MTVVQLPMTADSQGPRPQSFGLQRMTRVEQCASTEADLGVAVRARNDSIQCSSDSQAVFSTTVHAWLPKQQTEVAAFLSHGHQQLCLPTAVNSNSMKQLGSRLLSQRDCWEHNHTYDNASGSRGCIGCYLGHKVSNILCRQTWSQCRLAFHIVVAEWHPVPSSCSFREPELRWCVNEQLRFG